MIETGLLISMMAHIASANMLYEQTAELEVIAKEPYHVRLNRYTGQALAYIVPVHVLATRVGALVGRLRPADYDMIRTTLTGLPALFFVPYYALLAASGVYHSLQGTFLGLCRLGVLPQSWFAKYANNVLWMSYIGASLAATAAGIYGFATIEGIPESSEYWNSKLPAILQKSSAISRF